MMIDSVLVGKKPQILHDIITVFNMFSYFLSDQAANTLFNNECFHDSFGFPFVLVR